MKTITTIVLIFAGLAANTIGRWLPACQDLWYFRLQAVSITLWVFAGLSTAKNKSVKIAWEAVAILSMFNLFDEFVKKKPENWTEIEVVAGALTVIISITLIFYEQKRCGNNYRQ